MGHRRITRTVLGFIVMGMMGAFFFGTDRVDATDYPHNPEKLIQCASCHRLHGAGGTRLTLVGGIVNLCQLCHNASGQAHQFTLDYGDQAVPGSSGSSHGFEKPASHPGYDASPPLDSNMNRNQENGNIVCTTCHNVHNHQLGFPFLWKDRGDICGECHTSRVQSAPPYTSHPVNVPVPGGDPDYKNPDHLELINGQVKCLTCHGVHYTYSGTQYRGTADGGSTTCLQDNSAAWTAGALVGWELKIGMTANPNRHNWYQRRIITSNTATQVCWTDPLPDSVSAGDPYVLKETGTGDGYLTNQPMASLCFQCHSFPATGSHFTSANALWPGGQYGSDYAYTDATGTEVWPPGRSGGVTNQPLPSSLVGSCLNCHWPHGWPDGNGGKYPRLTVDLEERLCYTCHDGNPASTDVRTHFETSNWVTAAAGWYSNPNLNSHHDVNDADQSISGAKIECVNCHDPHRVTPTNRLVSDPDPSDGRVPAPDQTWSGSDYQSEWCLDCHDGTFSPDVTPPSNQLMDIRGTYLREENKHTKPGGRSKKGNWRTPLPCTACHDPNHKSTNLFQLREVVLDVDGTPLPSDCGPGYRVIDNNSTDQTVNGWCWCNTCHQKSMGKGKTNCFKSGCHNHGKGAKF